MASKYGPEAQVRTSENVTFASGAIEGVGMEPVVVGKVFGLKPGKRTEAIEGQSGVIVAEVQNITPATAPADLASLKKQMETGRMNRIENNVYEAIKADADIKDSRVKFF